MSKSKPADIAIIGMACRFPGANDYWEYWDNLQSGRNCVKEVPGERWDWRKYVDSSKPHDESGKWGGFIQGVDEFDALFFKMSPREASFVDPQHRLFLQCTYNAIEDAGIDIATLAGKAVGVYAGVSKNDYAELMREDKVEISSYVSTGTVHSILTNRISFLFNFTGKSEPVDTACSSALVALHNALRDLATGEIELGVVGGVNLLLSPTIFVSHGKSGMLAADGRCKSFDAAANGYVRGEGVGVILIKPLDLALADGDSIHAVIKGSAVNHGGRSLFLTSPSVNAQAAVINKAFADAQMLPEAVTYIEAHGTGTEVGDPIEVNALKKAYEANPRPLNNGHCYIGSAKTYIGHLEAAAGMAGLIKVVMSMKFGIIPKLMHFNKVNPQIDLVGSPFSLAVNNTSWAASNAFGEAGLRTASVSSFGMGGVNAHVIVQEPPVNTNIIGERSADVLAYCFSSAKGALRAQLRSHLDYFTQLKRLGRFAEIKPAGVACTLCWGRSILAERCVVIARDLDDLLLQLERLLEQFFGDLSKIWLEEALRDTAMSLGQLTLAEDYMSGKRPETFGSDKPRPARLAPYCFAKNSIWYKKPISENIHSPLATGVTNQVSTNSKADEIIISNNIVKKAEFRVDSQNINEHLPQYESLLADHQVAGTPIVPAMGFLFWIACRFAKDASSDFFPLSFRDTYWLRPTPRHPLKVTFLAEGEFSFSGNDGVNAKGYAFAGGPINHPIPNVWAEQGLRLAELGHSEIYALMNKHGLHYGPTFTRLQTLEVFSLGASARFTVDQSVQVSQPFNPSVFDAALQVVVAYMSIGLGLVDQHVPFYLESCVLLQPISTSGVIHIQRLSSGPDNQSFALQIYDDQQNLLAFMHNFVKRPLQSKNISPATVDAKILSQVAAPLFYSANWAPVDTSRDEVSASINGPILLVNCPNPAEFGGDYYFLWDAQFAASARIDFDAGCLFSDPSQVHAAVEKYMAVRPIVACVFFQFEQDLSVAYDYHRQGLTLLWTTKALIATRRYRGIKLLSVAPDDIRASAVSLGFYRTLHYENPGFQSACWHFESVPDSFQLRRIFANITFWQTGRPECRRTNSNRDWRLELQRISMLDNKIIRPASKPKSVLITGGAGGLGFVISQAMVKKWGCDIIWLGRRPINNQISSRIQTIRDLGVACHYYSCDLSDLSSLAVIEIELVRLHPNVDAVIHAAGLIQDAYILKTQSEGFSGVLSPKVDGVLALQRLSANWHLQFMVLFSSIAAYMPNQGQCAYSAGNCFLDAFAAWRNQEAMRSAHTHWGKTLAINWPLWANGGMGVSREEAAHLLDEFGMHAMADEAGVEAFFNCLALIEQNNYHNLMVIVGDQQKIERHFPITSINRITSPVTLETQSMDQPVLPLPNSKNQVSLVSEKHLAHSGNPSNPGLLEDWLLQTIARLMPQGRPVPSGPHELYADFALDSVLLSQLAAVISQAWAVQFTVAYFFEVENVAQTAKKIVHLQTVAPPDWRQRFSLLDVDQPLNHESIYQRRFAVDEFYLRDHVVGGLYNMPGACFIEMALQACHRHIQLHNLAGRQVLALTDNYWVAQLSSAQNDFSAFAQLANKSDGRWSYEIFSRDPGGNKKLHANGDVTVGTADELSELRVVSADLALANTWSRAQVYNSIIGEGLHVQDSFMPMVQLRANRHCALAQLQLPESVLRTDQDFVLHPSLLTGVFQVALICNRELDKGPNKFIPIGIDEIRVHGPMGSRLEVVCQAHELNQKLLGVRKFDIDVCNLQGKVLVQLRGFSLRQLAAAVIDEPKQHQGVEEKNIASLIAQLKHLLSDSLGIAADDLDAQTPFESYGVNSVSIVEMNQSLERQWGRLSKTLFFEYRNLQELAEYLAEQSSISKQPAAIDAGVPMPQSIQPKVLSENAPVTGLIDPAIVPRLVEQLRHLVASCLQLDPVLLDPHTVFEDLGVNSIVVHEINTQLERVFGRLSKTLLFEYRSVFELAEYFAQLQEAPAVLDGVSPPANWVSDNQTSSVALLQPETSASNDTGRSLVFEPIAIVGMAGRYASADDLDSFWQSLLKGQDLVIKAPADRMAMDALFNADPKAGGIYADWGGFLNDVARFDAGLFGISPREAELIDPQERLMLEVAWECLQDAGYSKPRLAQYRAQTAVFVAAIWQPYNLMGAEVTARSTAVAPSGLLYSIANRISFSFDLLGPSMAVDTACSGSLTALHLACQSLRTGESKMAVVGGVNLSLHASKYLFLSQNRFLSSEGRCRSFGAGGDGYVPGEGVGAVLLKPLSLALADGDQIYGTILGSAINHGGRTNGYTVPDPKAQARVIEQAVAAAGIDPGSIGYIEAHGTGTQLGDPIEVSGLSQVYRRPALQPPLPIGSVKGNIGHLEAAAAMAGLSKILLQFRHQQIVPSLHSAVINPNLSLEQEGFELPQQVRDAAIKRSGLSSFGAGGANGHLVVESFPVRRSEQEAPEPQALPLSARTLDELVIYVQGLVHWLNAQQVLPAIQDLAKTLQTGRDHWPVRVLITAQTIGQWRGALGEFLQNPRAGRSYGSVADSAAEAWCRGENLPWQAQKGFITRMPPPPLRRERYWLPGASAPAVLLPHRHEAVDSGGNTGVIEVSLVNTIAGINGVFWEYIVYWDNNPQSSERLKRQLGASLSCDVHLANGTGRGQPGQPVRHLGLDSSSLARWVNNSVKNAAALGAGAVALVVNLCSFDLSKAKQVLTDLLAAQRECLTVSGDWPLSLLVIASQEALIGSAPPCLHPRQPATLLCLPPDALNEPFVGQWVANELGQLAQPQLLHYTSITNRNEPVRHSQAWPCTPQGASPARWPLVQPSQSDDVAQVLAALAAPELDVDWLLEQLV